MSTPYCYLSLILQRGNRDLYRKLAWVTNLIDEYTKHLGNREDPNRGGETIHELLPQNLYIEILASVWWYNKNKNNNTEPFLPTRELHINRKHCLSCRGSSLKVPHGITRLLLLPPKARVLCFIHNTKGGEKEATQTYYLSSQWHQDSNTGKKQNVGGTENWVTTSIHKVLRCRL